MSECVSDIQIDQLTRTYGSLHAVDSLSLSVRRGRVLGLIGQNGAGKSTLMRMLVGLLKPTSGQISIAGLSLAQHRDELKWQIGYVPDRPTIYSWMRVQQAIDFCQSLYGQRFNAARCAEFRRHLRLDPKRKVGKLSKGEAAKLQLLLAICHEPQVLILDEPTDGMDLIAREEFFESVIRVAGEREQTVVLSSHSLSDVRRLADDLAFIHHGKLLMHGAVDDLLARMKRVRAVLPDNHKPVVPTGAIWQELRGREWSLTLDHFKPEQIELLRRDNPVDQIETYDMSLEDVFRDVVRGQNVEVA